MRTLVIETSTERGMVAFLDGGQLLCHAELPFGFNNSKFLIPTLEHQLKNQKLSVKDFGLIAVGVGPGSYTGIRVGATVAKALAYACNIPLVGICSLEGFYPSNEGVFTAMIDAKIGGAYFLKGNITKGICTFTAPPQVCPLEDLEVLLDGVKTIVTPYSAIIKPKLHALLPAAAFEWEEKGPDPLHMGLSAIRKFENGEASFDSSLELLYMRRTQAELEREQGQQDKKK